MKITKGHIVKLIQLVKHKIKLYKDCYLNTVVRQQLKDIKHIPIIIISFNQVSQLKQLVNFLLERHYSNIVIVDNNSTYTPLLDYFKTLPSQVTLHRLKQNEGHLAFWKNKAICERYTRGYYVVTDADVLPLDACPDDFLKTFIKLLDKAYDRTKVGFSLKLDDIPDTNPNKPNILTWESKYWTTKIHPLAYKAEIDTTFALYRPGYQYQLKNFTKAWRTDYPLQARHGGWYLDINYLTDEQKYYIKTANKSASWNIDAKGKLINQAHKPLYYNE